MTLQKKRFLKVVFLLLLLVALAGVYCGTSLRAWTMWARGLREQELPSWSAADLKTLRNPCPRRLWRKKAEMAQMMVKLHSVQKELKKVVSEMTWESYVHMSDWALKSSGASTDTKRTSKTYDCEENGGCWISSFFCTLNPPDTILEPDVTPGSCWCFRGHQGQVVIRLPVRVHLTAIIVQHISKEASPSGTVTSAPRDIAAFGVDADGEEAALLGMFMYDVAKDGIQTFPLKNAPLPRAFSYIKLLVKSNWGNPAHTCIYRVQVHGRRAKPENLD